MKGWEDPSWEEAKTISIDVNNVFRVGEKYGLSANDFLEIEKNTPGFHKALVEERRKGILGFYDLPYDENTAAKIKDLAQRIRKRFENLVVLGIGGSALGTITIKNALEPRPEFSQERHPKVFVIDNVDPDYFFNIINSVDLSRTCFMVISKSGTTAETMSQFMVVHDLINKAGGAKSLSDQIIAITDPEKGHLRDIAIEEGYQILNVPPNVGGRFSVLTPVGLLPAAVMGVDIDELLAGARYMDRRCASENLWENPAYVLGSTYYLSDYKKGQNTLVFMPYCNALYSFADWLRQLIAESLGKRFSLDGKEVFAGPTPIKALGATDQHSQLQLYMEGPFNKMITFFRVEQFRHKVTIPKCFAEIDALNYLGNKTMEKLLLTEQKATAVALTRQGRSNLSITIPEVSSYSLGQLFFLFEVTTVFMGKLYNINPLDQPGVEESKINTYAMMGRQGFEDRNKQLTEQLRTDPCYII